jgi:UDP-glucuronate 4-epimerase
MSERILLTGAAGFIGSHLAERLLADGHEVVGVDNFDPFYSPAEKRLNLAKATAHPAFRLVEADCADPRALGAALEGETVDAIVHLAAKAGVRPSIDDPVGYARANVMATQVLLELAREHGVERFIFGSSSSVYGNQDEVPFAEDDPALRPISPYAATKRAGELLCHAFHHLHGMRVIALRFFTVYGPRQRPDLAIRKFATLMLDGEPIPMFGDGSTERDYTWIDDIIDGVIASLDRTRKREDGFEIINLGGNRTTPLHRLIELIAEALDVRPEIRTLPMQPGDVIRTYADVDKARRLLGYRPSVSVEEGVPRFVDWLTRRRRERLGD